MLKKLLIIISILIFIPLSANAEKVNVAFTIDNNYPIFTLLAINSILKNNTSNSEYTFYIIENDITKKNKEKMKHYVSDLWGQKIVFYNIDSNIMKKYHNKFYRFQKNRISTIGIIRILIPEILPTNIHKVLYLDGDILVTDDLTPLYNYNLKENPAGLAKNHSKEKYIIHKFKKYYNSGVILMDLDKWRKQNISYKMTDYLDKNINLFIYNKNTTKGSIYRYGDQDLINLVLEGNITTLPYKWNNQEKDDIKLSKGEKNGIYHYIGPVKPWNFATLNKYPSFKKYIKYWNESDLLQYKYYYKIIAQAKKIKKLSSKKIYKYIKLFHSPKTTNGLKNNTY